MYDPPSQRKQQQQNHDNCHCKVMINDGHNILKKSCKYDTLPKFLFFISVILFVCLLVFLLLLLLFLFFCFFLGGEGVFFILDELLLFTCMWHTFAWSMKTFNENAYIYQSLFINKVHIGFRIDTSGMHLVSIQPYFLHYAVKGLIQTFKRSRGTYQLTNTSCPPPHIPYNSKPNN